MKNLIPTEQWGEFTEWARECGYDESFLNLWDSKCLELQRQFLEDSAEAPGRANLATYDDWFPDHRPIVAGQQGGGWISLGGYVDPPPAPNGFATEVRRDSFLGIVTAYRFVRLS